MYYLLGLPVSLGLFAYYVATRPAAFRIARSRTIDAPASVVFELINDLRAWEAWSPWEKIDPSMKKTFGEGPAAGKGASYAWVGSGKSGEGSMTILESAPSSRVDVEVRFIKPFAATNRAIFTLEPAGAGSTTVTWAMEGENNFALKAFNVFINMDKALGKDFDAGLAAMREAAEAAAKARGASHAVTAP